MREIKYIVLKSFLSAYEEIAIVKEVLACHRDHCSGDADSLDIDPERTSSLKLELGITCGGDLSAVLKISSRICRRAFEQASRQMISPTKHTLLHSLYQPNTPLTGLSLLYGPLASMSPHYDSPTQSGQKEEWLCMFTFGLPCVFRLDDRTVELRSGDALVMDSMAVLHGVERILSSPAEEKACLEKGLPIQCRLGVLFWHGRAAAIDRDTTEIPVIDGLAGMFAESENEDENENDYR